jgi:Transglutaminase-like superfamily
MIRLVLESWISLLHFDFVLRFRGLQRVHEIVRDQQVRSFKGISISPANKLCRAVDLACVFYFKQVLCLQRSAATAVLLRRHGWKAEMVIGAQVRPFRSHAWVEIDRSVVSDKPYMLEMYQELERC